METHALKDWVPKVTPNRERYEPKDIVEGIMASFKQVNANKAVGPDGVNIKLLKQPKTEAAKKLQRHLAEQLAQIC